MTAMAGRAAGDAAAEAEAAIKALGALARAQVGPSALDWFGHWLAWPDWLFAGTNIKPSAGALPPRISVADDLRMVANIIDHGAASDLLQRIASGQLPSVGPISMMAQTYCPTVGDFLQFLPGSITCNTPYAQLELETGPATCCLKLDSPVLTGSLLSFLGILAMLVCARTLIASIVGDEQHARIETDWPGAAGGNDIARLMPIPIMWGTAGNRLIIPARWMAINNPWHDQGMWLMAQERLRALELARGAETEVARLSAWVADVLTRDRRLPRLKQMAASHGMSERSLGRLLAPGGTSFQAIVDDERRNRAAQMINDPTYSLKEMADLLGFPDVSSFGRSFRRWFGQTPGKLHRQLIAPEA